MKITLLFRTLAKQLQEMEQYLILLVSKKARPAYQQSAMPNVNTQTGIKTNENTRQNQSGFFVPL